MSEISGPFIVPPPIAGGKSRKIKMTADFDPPRYNHPPLQGLRFSAKAYSLGFGILVWFHNENRKLLKSEFKLEHCPKSYVIDNSVGSDMVSSADLPSLYSQEHAQFWWVFLCQDFKKGHPLKYTQPSLSFSD